MAMTQTEAIHALTQKCMELVRERDESRRVALRCAEAFLYGPDAMNNAHEEAIATALAYPDTTKETET